MPKVLMPMVGGQHDQSANAGRAYASAARIWRSLGYDVDIVTVDIADDTFLSAAPTVGYGETADILCFPYVNTDLVVPTTSNFGKVAVKGFGQVPVFTMNYNATAGNYGIGGVQGRVVSAYALKKVFFDSADRIYTGFTRRYNDWEGSDTGTVTPIAATAYPMTEANGAELVAWRWESVNSPNGSPSYIASNDPDSVPLIIMIQAAVERGDIPAPTKKINILFDFDDFPDAANTAAEVARVASKLTEHGLKGTCGIHGSFDPTANTGQAEAIEHLDVFNFIDHQVAGASNPYFFNWDGTDASGDITPLEMDTRHRANVAAMQAVGTNMQLDGNGYKFFNQNAISAEGLALMSWDTSIGGDPNGVTPQAGYGVKVVRMDDTSINLGNGNLGILSRCEHMARQQGCDIAAYRTVSNTTINSATTDDATYLGQSIAMYRGFLHNILGYKYISLALHNVDTYDGHDSGTAGSPGTTHWERVVDFIMGCNHVYKTLDPTKLKSLPSNFD